MRELRITPRRKAIPMEVIKSKVDRAWLGGLIQGEGAITTYYMRSDDTTKVTIDIDIWP
ncbi:MAG: hypothetical protein QXL52_03810 [Nitrososphaerales archaeon]